MSQIVHITFEKLNRIPGTIEGVFICDEELDTRLPLVFNAFLISKMEFVFVQDGRYFYMKLANWRESINYIEHFLYGGPLLIKEWSHGSGVDTGSKNPN